MARPDRAPPIGPGVASERPGWQLVLPVKGGPGAKSRLGGPPAQRAVLASALAFDCLDAVLACPRVAAVHVVSADAATAREAVAAGARAVPETSPGGGLLAAVRDGVRAAGRAAPDAVAARTPRATAVPGVAVLLADLPCLRPEDLSAALGAVEEALRGGAPAVFVPDAEGTGTVLLAAPGSAALRPRFGAGSAAAHAAAGAVRLDLDVPRLRRDVDTPAELAAAVRLGVGARTREALAASGGSPQGPSGGGGLRPRREPVRCRG